VVTDLGHTGEIEPTGIERRCRGVLSEPFAVAAEGDLVDVVHGAGLGLAIDGFVRNTDNHSRVVLVGGAVFAGGEDRAEPVTGRCQLLRQGRDGVLGDGVLQCDGAGRGQRVVIDRASRRQPGHRTTGRPDPHIGDRRTIPGIRVTRPVPVHGHRRAVPVARAQTVDPHRPGQADSGRAAEHDVNRPSTAVPGITDQQVVATVTVHVQLLDGLTERRRRPQPGELAARDRVRTRAAAVHIDPTRRAMPRQTNHQIGDPVPVDVRGPVTDLRARRRRHTHRDLGRADSPVRAEHQH
jgi:hypothetical protein